jgi:hypothetical protein
VRIAAAVALVEGILIVFDAISGWAAIAVAAVVLAFYFAVGRHLRRDVARDASWTAALSQVLVVFVPVATFVFGVVVLLALAVLAAVALFVLVADRR